MIKELRSLNVKGDVELWCKSIGDYYWSSRWNTDYTTLAQLRDKIISESLPDGGIQMVNRAIDKLLMFGKGSYTGLKTPPSFVRPPTPFLPRVSFPEHDNPLPECCESPVLLQLLPSEDERRLRQLDLLKSRPVYAALRVFPALKIKQHLQKFIAGQDEVLSSLSLIVHRFLCNGALLDAGKKAAGKPPHCILTGPSGSGKSETLRQLALFLDIPFLHVNAPCITAEGYKGINFSEVVGDFWKVNNRPISAIVVLEEIDKLGSKDQFEQKNFGEEIQKLLLSSLDGNPLNTSKGVCVISNWLFIGTGAFSVLSGKRGKNLGRKATAITHDDLKKAGFLPEFANRFKSILTYKNHTKATMLEVLAKEGSPLDEIKSEFKNFYNVNLTFEPSISEKLAEISLKVDTGVRALHTILGKILEPYYELAASMLGEDCESLEKHLEVNLKDIEKSLDAFNVEEKEDDGPLFRMYL